METWGDLVVLPENRSAVRAARRVVALLARPRRTRGGFACPLFLHGPPGSGKTAVVRGLVRAALALPATQLAQVVPAGELPRAGKDADASAAADLRACDLLVVEDLHRLRRPDHAAFLQLLDFRASRRAPTVVTATAGPARLPALPRRLSSRLAGGLVVRLGTLSLVSRVKLVGRVAPKLKLNLSTEAIHWLARQATGTRPLLGLLETLRATVKPSPIPLTATRVRESLSESAPPPQPAGVLQGIVVRVAAAYGVTAKDLLGRSRLGSVSLPRQVAMYLAHELAARPLAEVGRHFGGRDHTTVLHAVRKIAAARRADPPLAARLRELAAGL